ncbi:MAG TPA: hypothetical protein DEO94_04365 [Cyanobacteria bacterium UBA11991]|nr:hypothetical protein [Cyanobacteriota bacterium]MDY6358975.1 hypothetical protein [Cyanobacteriota bacterium]MDY6364261.1 hypothetical protein [Cyanobacteriota bacterium]MDY6382736.1 hypothetical protein [Cyanobacteriota bacterium]HCB11367.1 hypothetical protein [Cyanobacteria bacterium UBA11991]
MKKRIWKMEYTLVLLVVFAVLLFLIPTSFSSKEAVFVSEWNAKYNKIEYTFTAMSAHAESDIIKNFKKAKSGEQKEKYMIKLAKPYLRLKNLNPIIKEHYVPHYMNGKPVKKDDFYYFSNLYESDTDSIVGIKDIPDTAEDAPGFMIMVDMNGIKKPNRWGKDIYGVNVYKTGQIAALGKDKNIKELRKDCSEKGSGVACSHFYRIGGEFSE